MATRRSAEDAQAAVQQQHPHFSLVLETYESKCLPATWHCNLHDVQFRYPASSLARPGCLGCPGCKEERYRAKRRERYADPHLERHVSAIRERLGDEYATMWRLRTEGFKLMEIGEKFDLSEQSIDVRLARIRRLLTEFRA